MSHMTRPALQPACPSFMSRLRPRDVTHRFRYSVMLLRLSHGCTPMCSCARRRHNKHIQAYRAVRLWRGILQNPAASTSSGPHLLLAARKQVPTRTPVIPCDYNTAHSPGTARAPGRAGSRAPTPPRAPWPSPPHPPAPPSAAARRPPRTTTRRSRSRSQLQRPLLPPLLGPRVCRTPLPPSPWPSAAAPPPPAQQAAGWQPRACLHRNIARAVMSEIFSVHYCNRATLMRPWRCGSGPAGHMSGCAHQRHHQLAHPGSLPAASPAPSDARQSAPSSCSCRGLFVLS